jgi:predicted HTH transcriptional regulator
MKFIVEVPDEKFAEFYRTFEMATNLVNIDVNMTPYVDPVQPKKHGGRKAGVAVVKYEATAGLDVMDALSTTDGIVFKFLVEHGPATEKQIREARNLKQKTVESAVHRLKHMTVVRAVPIKADEALDTTGAA